MKVCTNKTKFLMYHLNTIITYTIKTMKVRIYSDDAEPWILSADVIILKVETSGGETGAVVRSSFDPSRMYVEESECYLYTFQNETDTSIPRFAGRLDVGSAREYNEYYYDQDYEQAKARPIQLIKLRIDNLIIKPNHTVLGMNSSHLLFSVLRKRFNYKTGIIFCDESFDSLLFSTLRAPPPYPPVSIFALIQSVHHV
ncbi:hypothetical protein WDU94_007013 [Cyamophila willieti]